MINFSDFLNEGAMEVKQHFISKGIAGYKDTPEDKARFISDVKTAGIGNSNDAGKAWKSFQTTKEIFAPGKQPHKAEPKKSPLTDAEIKALDKAWADVKTAYEKATKMSASLHTKVAESAKGTKVHIKETPELYMVLKGLEMSSPSEDFSKRIAQISGFASDVGRYYKKL